MGGNTHIWVIWPATQSTVAGRATDRAPEITGEFRALVISAGGLVEESSADELKRWKRDLDPVIYDRMMAKVSMELMRARARLFEV